MYLRKGGSSELLAFTICLSLPAVREHHPSGLKAQPLPPPKCSVHTGSIVNVKNMIFLCSYLSASSNVLGFLPSWCWGGAGVGVVACWEELQIGLKIDVSSPHPQKRITFWEWLSSQGKLPLPLGEESPCSKKHLTDSTLVPVALPVRYSQNPSHYLSSGVSLVKFSVWNTKLCDQRMPCCKWDFVTFVWFHSCLSSLLRGILGLEVEIYMKYVFGFLVLKNSLCLWGYIKAEVINLK